MDLVTCRKRRGLTQAQFADELGLGSKAYVSQLETGAAPWPIKLALRVDVWSGGEVPADELVVDDDAQLLGKYRENANRRACAEAPA